MEERQKSWHSMSPPISDRPTSRLRPRSATTLPSLRERRPSTGLVVPGSTARNAQQHASPRAAERRPQSERRARTDDRQKFVESQGPQESEKPWMLIYLSQKDPPRACDRPPVPDYGYDHHNFWHFLQDDGTGKNAARLRNRAKGALPAEDPDEILPPRVTLDMAKRTRLAKAFIERNHQRMWKFRAAYRHQSPQEILDSIVHSMQFDAIMHDLQRREQEYTIGKSSEQIRLTLEQRESYIFRPSDPYLSSLTTSRTARRLRQERLFMPAYAGRTTVYNRVKATF